MLDPDLQILGVLADLLGQGFQGTPYRYLREVVGAWTGARKVGQAALGQVFGQGVGLPVQHVVVHGGLARGDGHERGNRAGDDLDLVPAHQFFYRRNRFLGVGGVAANDLDLAAAYAALGVEVVRGKLVIARQVITYDRHTAGIGRNDTDLDRAGLRRGREHHTAGRGERQSAFGQQLADASSSRFRVARVGMPRCAKAPVEGSGGEFHAMSPWWMDDPESPASKMDICAAAF